MKIKLSKSQWEQAGKTAGWMQKTATGLWDRPDKEVSSDGPDINPFDQIPSVSGKFENLHDRLKKENIQDTNILEDLVTLWRTCGINK